MTLVGRYKRVPLVDDQEATWSGSLSLVCGRNHLTAPGGSRRASREPATIG
jgi:hypothetical protein